MATDGAEGTRTGSAAAGASDAPLATGGGPVPAAAPGEAVILVDERDQPVGVESKLAAHQNGGKLHRAFSVFIFNGAGQMLLQRRSLRKYHFGGLWTNACCSHPRPGQPV